MSLGKDLASIRKSKNLSLEDIQNAIKIPLDTLTRIEDDSIFTDYDQNKTYIRSFVRSYARMLKIEDDEIVHALDEVEAGTYSGGLLSESEHPTDTDVPEVPTTSTPKSSTEESLETSQPAKADPEEKEDEAPTKKESPQEKESDTPELNTINWADMGRRFTTAGKGPKIWVIASIAIALLVLGGGGYFFWDNIGSLFSSSEPEVTEQIDQQEESTPIPPATADSATTDIPIDTEELESDPTTNTQPPQPITLGDTLTVTVYAAFGQLEPVRVTSDLNWRTNPFWMEEGEAYNFNFSDTLLVRGQYSRLLLLFNGHVIENPRQNNFSSSFNSIMLTRDVLDQPQYLAPSPEEFPLEVGAPDSTVYRIRF